MPYVLKYFLVFSKIQSNILQKVRRFVPILVYIQHEGGEEIRDFGQNIYPCKFFQIWGNTR